MLRSSRVIDLTERDAPRVARLNGERRIQPELLGRSAQDAVRERQARREGRDRSGAANWFGPEFGWLVKIESHPERTNSCRIPLNLKLHVLLLVVEVGMPNDSNR